jgi:uncharacterized SAM-binding protein YcdF (DUF218 family)
MIISDQVLTAAEILWDYHLMNMKPEKADIIFILGSHDLRVADYGAELFLKGLAPWLLISGGVAHSGDLLETDWGMSEAEAFARRAVSLGVPEEKIILECRAANTGENVRFSEKILDGKGIRYEKVLALQKPYMERRCYATIKKLWPRRDLIVSSPPLSFEAYPNEEIGREELINLMTGDLQRIIEYPAKGFQIPQDVPDHVLQAYHILLSRGFDRHAI